MGIAKEDDDLDLVKDLHLWVEEGRQVREIWINMTNTMAKMIMMSMTPTPGVEGGYGCVQEGECDQCHPISLVYQVDLLYLAKITVIFVPETAEA